MRPVTEQTILITGATDGLGRRVAEDLAAAGATVLVHGRNPERLARTLAEITEATGNDRVTGYLADLADLSQVHTLAEEITTQHNRLDVLVNNAGVGAGPPNTPRQMSVDGYELRFAVNYLAGYALTLRLMPLLRAAAPSRIVNVASVGQEPIDFTDVMLEHGYDGWRAYRQSKLAQIMFTIDLAERLAGTGVTVNALHPASLMNTKMVFEALDYTLSTIEDGAAATERLILDPDLEGVTGCYFDQQQQARAHAQAYDAGARARLWELSERLTGVTLT